MKTEQAEIIGRAIAKELQLISASGSDSAQYARFNCRNGVKTYVGLAMTVQRIIENVEEWNEATA